MSASARNWDDPDVHLAQQISDRRFVDGNHKTQFVSTKGMPESMRSPATAGGTAAASGAAASGTTPAAVASSAGAASGTAPATAAKGISNSMKTAKANWGKLSRKGKMIRGLAVLGGGLMIYEGTVGNEPHSWSDVIYGAGGGATIGGTIGSAIPGVGTVIGGAAGAVLGSAIGGAKFFSESGGDCVYDEMLPNVYTCCATVFNKGARYVDIGGTMLCEMADGNPGVRTCLNGDSTTTHSIFKNDRWSDCQSPDTMWCPGVQKPANDDGVLYVPTLDGVPEIATKKSKIVKDTEESQLSEEDIKHVKVCWDWVCDDTAGYTKQDNICSKTMKPAPSTDETTIDGMINRLEKLRAEIIKDCGTLGQ